jgi:hypothetical protein
MRSNLIYYNIKLQHPVALGRSDFAFQFFTVYMQRWLAFSIRFFSLLSPTLHIDGKKRERKVIVLLSLELSERNEENITNLIRVNLRARIRIRNLTNMRQYCTHLATTFGLRDESFLQKYLNAFFEISCNVGHSDPPLVT